MTEQLKDALWYDITLFRVWPDGTVQEADQSAYTWMSDDYMRVEATSEDEALRVALQREAENYKDDARHE